MYKKQTGGRGKFADIIVKVGPVDEGFEGSLQFIDKVKNGNIPKEYIPSVQKGFQAAMKNGVLAGFPVDTLKVTQILVFEQGRLAEQGRHEALLAQGGVYACLWQSWQQARQ